MPNRRTLQSLAVLVVACSLTTAHANAQNGGATKWRDVTIYVGSGAGGAYDTYARLVSRHLGSHLPGNPNVLVSNMPGAAGRRVMSWLYGAAPKDGTAIGTALSTLAFDPLTGEAAQFDAQKLTWIGSANKETATCITWSKSQIQTLDDAKKQTARVGSSGPSSTDSIYPNVMNKLFGTKFKVISGYASAPQMNLAIEQGELDGRCGLTWTSLQSLDAAWMKAKAIRIILQFALEKNPELQGVPFALDLAKNEEQREIITLWAAPNQMGRPFFAPPDIGADKTQTLRRAFDAMSKDPAYKADAAGMNLGVDAMSGEEVEALVNKVYATPKQVVDLAGAAAKGE